MSSRSMRIEAATVLPRPDEFDRQFTTVTGVAAGDYDERKSEGDEQPRSRAQQSAAQACRPSCPPGWLVDAGGSRPSCSV